MIRTRARGSTRAVGVGVDHLGLADALLAHAADEHDDDDRVRNSKAPPSAEPPAEARDAVDHDKEGAHEDDEHDLVAGVEVGHVGVAFDLPLGFELFTVIVAVAESRVPLDLLGVPMQVEQVDDRRDDQAEEAHVEALGEDGAGRVRGDNRREGVDRRERGAYRTRHEYGAHDHDRVVAERQEDRRENRVEGHRFLFEAAHRAAEDHEDRHAEDEQELATLGLFSQLRQARFERAGRFHDADQTAQAQDEDHDVD